jgi:hypothetical protein
VSALDVLVLLDDILVFQYSFVVVYVVVVVFVVVAVAVERKEFSLILWYLGKGKVASSAFRTLCDPKKPRRRGEPSKLLNLAAWQLLKPVRQ